MRTLEFKNLMGVTLGRRSLVIGKSWGYHGFLQPVYRILFLFNLICASSISTVSAQVGCPLIIQHELESFIATPNSSATTLWLNLHVKLNSNQLTTNGDYLMFSGGTLAFNSVTTSFGTSVTLPNGEIIADATASAPSTSFNSAINTWITRVPVGYSSPDLFIMGSAVTSNNGYTLSGVNNSTTLTGVLICNKLFSSTWSYGLACYQGPFNNSNTGVVNAVNNIPVAGFPAGAPSSQAGNLVSGGSGTGGANYTGILSLDYNFTSCINHLPTSYAGPDQQLLAGQTSATLSGSGTGSGITFAWTKTSGGNAAINSPTSPSTTVTGLSAGTYNFQLTVTDPSGNSAASSMNLMVYSLLTANAGNNQTFPAGTASASLSGSASGGSGNYSYLWTMTSGANCTISNNTQASANVTGLTSGSYTFNLLVTDINTYASANSSVQIVVLSSGSNGSTQLNHGNNNPYTVAGQSYNLQKANNDWQGVVADRSSAYQFNFIRNYVTSDMVRDNVGGNTAYLLQFGEESPGSNNWYLNNMVISGNSLNWTGGYRTPQIQPHGVFAAYSIDDVITYNYVNQLPMAIIQKGDGTHNNDSSANRNSKGAIAYNIVYNPMWDAVNIKGMGNTNVFNNTFYSSVVPAVGIIDIYDNAGTGGVGFGTHIYNNIFYSTSTSTINIRLETSDCLSGFQSDYNLFYCEAGTPMFKIGNTTYTFAQWQALGYDIHSVVVNPNFNDFTNFVPSSPLNYGTNLGPAWQSGLAANATWSTSAMPATANQGSTWQVGARIVSPGTGIAELPNSARMQAEMNSGTISISAYPNPYVSEVNFNINSPLSGRGTLDVYDLSGRHLARIFSGDVLAGSEKTVTYQPGPSERQMLIYIFKIEDHIIRGKLMPTQ